MKALEHTGRVLTKALSAADSGRCALGVELGRYVALDLDASDTADFENHLKGCHECRHDLERYAEIEALWQQAAAKARATETSLWRRFVAWWSLPRLITGCALATVGLLLAVVPAPFATESKSILRAKGMTQLFAAVERGGEVFRVTPGMQLTDGDRLGFFYSSEHDVFLLLLHVDGLGEVTRLFPTNRTASARVEAGARKRLPDGAVLSPGSTGCEWIVGLFSEVAITEERAAEALGKAAATGGGECSIGEIGLANMEAHVVQIFR